MPTKNSNLLVKSNISCGDEIQDKKLNSEFNRILQKIQLVNEAKCQNILQKILPLVIESMKMSDSLFDKMYKCNVYTGSYYDKLRIKDACEFDVNLVLALPVQARFVKVEPSPSPHAVLHLEKQVANLGLTASQASQLQALLDSEGYVLPNKLLAWMQRIMDKAVLKDIKLEGVKQIKLTASGPARTLLILLDDIERTEISVDLVPVFQFPQKDWPRQLKNVRPAFVNEAKMEKRKLYLVPKCYKRGLKQSPNEPAKVNIPRIWRMHFADIEQCVLQKHVNSRPVIKLLKLLRDSQKWSNLHSYFLKTLVLNEIARNPVTEWKQDLLSARLLEMLKCLSKCLQKGMLPHLFFPSVNLLQYMSQKEQDNIKSRLSIIIKSICDNPDSVKTYFVA